MHIGKKIERIRLLRGMTQTDLGEFLGITKQSVSKMERSQHIDEDKLKQVLAVLGIGVNDFVIKEKSPEIKCNPNNIKRTLILYEELIRMEQEKFCNLIDSTNFDISRDLCI